MARSVGAEDHFGSSVDIAIGQESAWADLGIYTYKTSLKADKEVGG